MEQRTLCAVWGGLLHDVGKILFRARNSSENHSEAGAKWLRSLLPACKNADEILACARMHHAGALSHARIPSDSAAYIVYIADNISAAADRRSADGEGSSRFDRNLPLSPVFSHMNGEHPGKALPLRAMDGELRMPMDARTVDASAVQYQAIVHGLEQGIKSLPEISEAWTDSLQAITEGWLSNVPSSTYTGESPDISLFDHQKITAGVAACISEYLLDRGITDLRTGLFKNATEFYSEKAFLLYSADFSGIQKFIYTVATANALRSLRCRSFFLELNMEHYIDELLAACGMSRVNLLYSGGGHCYVLLPNTEGIKRALAEWNGRFNDWLCENFGNALYLADGWTECTANDLMNAPAQNAPYKAMFRRVSRAISKRKSHRYSAAQIVALNHTHHDEDGCECQICGRSDKLKLSPDGAMLCPWCLRFEQMSEQILRKQVVLVSRNSQVGMPLPARKGMVWLEFVDEAEARKRLASDEDIVRVYTINEAYSGLKYSARLFVGNYAASNRMDELAAASQGIRRLGVCRMDVDDLGTAFVSGFERKGDGGNAAIYNRKKEDSDISARMHYVTLSRTAAFSRHMSLFFKHYINGLLDGSYKKRRPLNVAIVYSGGDDLFLVGAWNDTIEAAVRIHDAFDEYTCGALSISGGVGIFSDHFPIRQAAYQTAELEDASKGADGKNAMTLFADEPGYTYKWNVLCSSIMGGKLKLLEDFFDDNAERGNALLYQMVRLLRDAQQDKNKLPLARFAYLLARMEPPRRDEVAHARYEVFSKKIYRYALDANERQELLLAMMIYVYLNRKGGADIDG